MSNPIGVAASRGDNDRLIFEKLVTREQLAELLEVSPSFISKLMAEEGLPRFKIGKAVRFRIGEVAAWLQKRRRP